MNSATVSAGDTILASQYNNLRTDAVTGLSGAHVYNNSSTTTLNHGTETAITFDSEIYDTGTYHDTSSNTERLTTAVAGLYLIAFHLDDITGDSGGNLNVFTLKTYKNGSEISTGTAGSAYLSKLNFVSSSDDTGAVDITFPYNASANDYFHFTLTQSSDNSENRTVGQVSAWIQLLKPA
jgi:hypothetical protein